MTFRILSGATAAALAGFALAVILATPSSAFSLSGQGLEHASAASNVERVWWDRWGRWHPNCWINAWGVRMCGPGPGPIIGPGPAPGPWMGQRCWIDRWGYRRCRW